MMMYHPINCGCKKISNSADMVETVISDQVVPHCDSELEDSKPIFLHDILAHDVASPYQVWLQKVQHLRGYHPDEHSLEVILNCDLEDSNPIFLKDNLAHNDALLYQVW